MSEEIWRDIPGYEGYYQVSNIGRVRSLDRIKCDGIRMRGRIKKTHYDACGYEMIQLRKDGAFKHLSVHRLVAQAFIPNPDNLPQVNHIDEIRNHNTVENLEWCTVEYNQNYGHRKEKASKSATGVNNARTKLTERDVREIRSIYIPGDKNYCKRILAEKYGVSYHTITAIVTKREWKHLL